LLGPGCAASRPTTDWLHCLSQSCVFHIVVFDYRQGFTTVDLDKDQPLAVMREGYVQKYRNWLGTRMRPGGVMVSTRSMLESGNCDPA
jgi:hypothetical protein